jgi:hypothetical protein
VFKHWGDLPLVIDVQTLASVMRVAESTIRNRKDLRSIACPGLPIRWERDTVHAYLAGSLKTEESQKRSDLGSSRKKVKLCL